MAVRVATVVGLIVIAAGIGVVWKFGLQSAQTEAVIAQPSLAPQESPLGEVDAPAIALDRASVDDGNAEADLELGYYCPAVGDTLAAGGALSDECVAALQRRYGDRDVFDPVVSFTEPLTFKLIYENPVGSRSAALEALRDERCAVPNGTINRDLAGECASREVIQHALLLSHCHRKRLDSNLKYELRPGGLAEDLGALAGIRDQASYWQRYRQVEDDHYGAAYAYAMCSGVPNGVVDLSAWEALTVEGSIPEEILTSRYGEAGDPHRTSVRLLMEFAARLGNEWALETYTRDEDHIRAMRLVHPLLAILHRSRFERWKRDNEYGEAQNGLAAEAKREIETLRNQGGDPDWLRVREGEIYARLRERQRELEDPHAVDTKHIRLTHLYAASAVATGYGISFDIHDHLHQLDEITQEEWDAARESALELFRSDWWK